MGGGGGGGGFVARGRAARRGPPWEPALAACWSGGGSRLRSALRVRRARTPRAIKVRRLRASLGGPRRSALPFRPAADCGEAGGSAGLHSAGDRRSLLAGPADGSRLRSAHAWAASDFHGSRVARASSFPGRTPPLRPTVSPRRRLWGRGEIGGVALRAEPALAACWSGGGSRLRSALRVRRARTPRAIEVRGLRASLGGPRRSALPLDTTAQGDGRGGSAEMPSVALPALAYLEEIRVGGKMGLLSVSWKW